LLDEAEGANEGNALGLLLGTKLDETEGTMNRHALWPLLGTVLWVNGSDLLDEVGVKPRSSIWCSYEYHGLWSWWNHWPGGWMGDCRFHNFGLQGGCLGLQQKGIIGVTKFAGYCEKSASILGETRHDD
jgi:hypothetical protein